ncbi:MAG: sulfatase-like hydrolase/transferase, partial [Lacunisphaera sp.]|nr:sulfatase-like hydrolase/transferase [Lacunisphaera sp.]
MTPADCPLLDFIPGSHPPGDMAPRTNARGLPARIKQACAVLGAAGLTAVAPASPAMAGADSPKPDFRPLPLTAGPNILWVVSEDNSPYTVGAYGDPLARTPNLDRLAARGIVYRRAFAAAPVCAPNRSTIITGRYASSLGTQHMRSRRSLPDNVGFFPEFLRAAGYFTSNNAKTDYNTSTPETAAWDENNKQAHWRHRRPGQPFFAVFNFEQSHESRLHERQPLLTDPAKVRVPAYLPDNPESRADLAQYYDCVTRADTAIGRILAQLAEDGLAEDTIIFYYSDNGGAVSRSKRFLYENGTQVALIMHFPEKYRHLAPAAAGSSLAELVNCVDLAPTMLSLAGLPVPRHFQGRAIAGPARSPAPAHTFMFRDRMDERYDLSRAVTDGRYRYIRHFLPHLPLGQHLDFLWKQASMRQWAGQAQSGQLNALQRAFFEPKAAEELFDCEADPDNVRNLAGEPAHRDTLDRLRAALRGHLLSSRDTGFLPEAMMIALSGASSPAVLAAQDTAYPLARILDLVDSCQLGQLAPTALASALTDPLPVMRYWSIMGALSLKPMPDLSAGLTDSDASVRLAAAEVILRHTRDPAAWRVLAAAL